ncbi:aggregation-promoting factor [Levilactobacillus tongjiangensis]|uniref:LysM peptidoglycan-binding domain-containing protein n=1 Tax=Levilactobacillus tongjiangensis TaxID=2486023 RepID=A0ABW1SPR4_9LACO|nr:LysM peptidoglycan-binding domain-containing protein [Levilactobacillus tongjiangensis]
MNIKKALVNTLGTVAVVGAGIFATNVTANADTNVTVKQGDSVWSLASKYDSSVSAIEKANSLSNSNLIFVGQKLNVPSSTQAATTSANASTKNYSHQATTTPASQSTTSQATTNHHTSTTSASTGVSGSEASAKAWIANKESGGSYSATNGQYIGKYQLSSSYLNGDYSAANQEKVANSYVASRYGSWSAAQAFWQANGWY